MPRTDISFVIQVPRGGPLDGKTQRRLDLVGTEERLEFFEADCTDSGWLSLDFLNASNKDIYDCLKRDLTRGKTRGGIVYERDPRFKGFFWKPRTHRYLFAGYGQVAVAHSRAKLRVELEP